MANSTVSYALPPLPEYRLTPLPPLVPGVPDKFLTVLLPVIAYWILSMFFHWIDVKDYFSRYRLHTPAEVLKRNHVSRWEVVRDVLVQQVIQTAVGLAIGMTEPDDVFGKENYDIAVWAQRVRMCQRAIPGILALIGVNASGLSKNLVISHPVLAAAVSGGQYSRSSDIAGSNSSGRIFTPAFADWEVLVAQAVYWFIVPAMQFALGIFIVDTWQYFLHRAMHMNKWLYSMKALKKFNFNAC